MVIRKSGKSPYTACRRLSDKENREMFAGSERGGEVGRGPGPHLPETFL